MDDGGVLRGLLFGGGTVVVIVVAAVVTALVLLFRRREGAKPSAASGLDALRTRANVLLVRADEAVKSADDELGFAVAQFGEERTREFATTLTAARAQLTEAFRLRHDLDDAFPESVQKQREWTLQVAALCENAIEALAGQDRGFSRLRGDEVAAPARLESVRAGIQRQSERLPVAKETLSRLRTDFDAALVASLDSVVADASALLSTATSEADAAAASVSPSGVNAVAERLSDAESAVSRASLRLDAVDTRAAQLDDAVAALEALVASSADDLAEARTQRDAAPGPDESAAIGAAIVAVEKAISAVSRRNPASSLDVLGGAIASLDNALASARNQKERLEHARAALGGTLASVASQLSEVRAFVTVGGRRVGADARTRLAEAERELAAATIPGADPVEALDAARRAVTHVRDADALARYDAQRSGR
jgi:hypothetical protein